MMRQKSQSRNIFQQSVRMNIWILLWRSQNSVRRHRNKYLCLKNEILIKKCKIVIEIRVRDCKLRNSLMSLLDGQLKKYRLERKQKKWSIRLYLIQIKNVMKNKAEGMALKGGINHRKIKTSTKSQRIWQWMKKLSASHDTKKQDKILWTQSSNFKSTSKTNSQHGGDIQKSRDWWDTCEKNMKESCYLKCHQNKGLREGWHTYGESMKLSYSIGEKNSIQC